MDAPDRPEITSALPSVGARIVAFLAILVGGACGAIIGFALADIQADTASSTAKGVGALVGGTAGALGVAVVAVLALRAMGEWKTIQERDEGDQASRIRRKPSA
jgi:FAD/FMN-containing dehydrogenase